ncbi:hypothetical protein PI125_g27176 [Phytophthora idaei]|nr:hypothetical protein PI125_g27176 [Phytophthora idaei]
MELRVCTAFLGQSVYPSESSLGTRLCMYRLSCVISVFNLNAVVNVVTLRVSTVIASLVQVVHLHSALGFVRPHHFRNVLHQDFLYCSAWYSPTQRVKSVVEVLACTGTEVVVPADAGTDVAESAEADSCAGVFVSELIAE